jgi:alpha-L-arabinofuranosidase
MTLAKILLVQTLLLFPAEARAETTTILVDANAKKSISPDLVGVFFEDLSYAADGGLYAELVQNRSFEYQPTEQPTWGPMTSWDFLQCGGGSGQIWVDSSYPLHPNNPHSVLLQINDVGEGVGLANSGFDGIPVKAGESYEFSVFTRMLNIGSRRDSKPIGKLPLDVRLETREGAVLGEASLEASSPAEWKKLAATITCSQTVNDARLVLLVKAPALIALDEISLFPANTFKGRKNGLRADIAQVIADMKPKFVRFPGGCLAHGDGINNIYDWKNTIGPVEQRKGQPNIWRYHQSVGLGYYEYFQFCEDIGAKPLPVIAAGVSCQNSSRTRGTGQQCIPMADMPAYVQNVLDLIEYANGPATSRWGAKRAEAGHPAPFGLKYIGIGNEDKITPEFEQRFKMLYDAVRTKYPEITVVGTVGPASDGEDFDKGWKLAAELKVPMVDEHYYKPVQWFWDHLDRYDKYDRSRPKVYLGEYAAYDEGRRSTLRAALAEAAALTSFERNGDVVKFSSYAPLLARRNHVHWSPDLIFFNGTEVFPTISYQVQKLFSLNGGDAYLNTTVSDAKDLAASTVVDGKTGDVIVKWVNGSGTSKALHLEFKGMANFPQQATKIILTGASPDLVNPEGGMPVVMPETSTITVGKAFDYEAPAYSLTILRIPLRH